MSRDPRDAHQGWAQGAFIDGPEYRHMPDAWKADAQAHEELMVRPGPKSNAICQVFDPHDAQWIARRLNRAAELEQRLQEFEEDDDG